jgi:hypothetical protein
MTTEARDHPVHRRYRQRAFFPREVSAGAEIAAPIGRVWQILTDLERYPEWNPFTTRVESTLCVGDPVRLHVAMPGRSRSVRTEWVNVFEPEDCIAWGMHMLHPALLNANRYQELTDLGNGRTRYYTVDRFSGLLVPVMMAAYAEPMRRGFESVARSLKARAENEAEAGSQVEGTEAGVTTGSEATTSPRHEERA